MMGFMLFADFRLARRLEQAEAAGAVACTEAEFALRPQTGAAFIEVKGASAAFHGIGSPLTQTIGLGFEGSVTASDMDCIEEFYKARGANPAIHFCPLADPSLMEQLSQRGYRMVECNNVLVRPLQAGEVIPGSPTGLTVRPARGDEAGVWSRVMLEGFLNREIMSDAEYAVGSAIFHCSMPWIAESAGTPLGGASFSVHQGLGCFSSDSTLPRARNRGVHSALIRARLRQALERGCDLATAAAQPGSLSQRNYERCGFRVAYTKLIMTRA